MIRGHETSGGNRKAAAVVIWGAYIGIKIAIAHKNEEKINARDMVKNLIIGIIIIFVVAMGALLAVSAFGEVRIVDYKYSTKDAETLRTHYAPQLKLYKKAVSKILRIAPEKIRCSFVNIYRGFETEAD